MLTRELGKKNTGLLGMFILMVLAQEEKRPGFAKKFSSNYSFHLFQIKPYNVTLNPIQSCLTGGRCNKFKKKLLGFLLIIQKKVARLSMHLW